MGLKNLLWKIIRNGKPAPFEHGPAAVVRNAKGKWEDAPTNTEESQCPVVHIPVERPTCKCGGNCACNRNETPTPVTTAKAPVKKKPKLEQVIADSERMAPLVAKTATKKPAAKKPAPKQK